MNRFLLSTLLALVVCASGKQKSLDAGSTLVWGPGVKTEIVLPVRYFFIQAVDNKGKNITNSVGVFNLKIYTLKNGVEQRVRARMDILDRNDGSYIIRYRLRESYQDLTIEVLYKGKQVADSPYTLAGMSYHEHCNCPEPDFEKYLEQLGCLETYPQIERDLARYDTIDMDYVTEEALKRYPSKNIIHFIVEDNEVYLKAHGRLTDFKMYMEAILMSLTRKVHLPDLDFFINLGDWPLVFPIEGKDVLPILAWCASEESYDILLPTYDVTRSTLEALDRVTLDLLSVQGNSGPKWKDKESLGFFRGRDSNKARITLIRMSLENPDLLDAKLTAQTRHKDEKDLGGVTKRISFYEFFKYKYQVSVDGTVAAYRLPYLLGGDSVILKQDSAYYEHFYKDMVPFEHFIPVKNDLSDLLDQLKWAKKHDKEARRIALNGRKFMQENLLPMEIYCYHAVFFKHWAKKLVSKPYVHEGMDHSAQPTDNNAKCDCQRKKSKQKKQKAKQKKKDEL